MLFHRLQHRRLSLGRGSVDLVAQHHVREDRTLFELEFTPAIALSQNLGARDIRGHQVRSELDAFETKSQRLAGGLDHQGLAESGYAFDQCMAAGEKRGEYFSDY